MPRSLQFYLETAQLQVPHRWPEYQLVAEAADIGQEHEQSDQQELVYEGVTIEVQVIDEPSLMG